MEKEAKIEAGKRVLPVPAPALKGLKTFRAIQAAEKLAAGDAYVDSGYVLVDELGNPFQTDKLRREAYKLMKAARSARSASTTRATPSCPGSPTTGYPTRWSPPGPVTRTWASPNGFTCTRIRRV
ncbi:hypothetical protein [Embleya sp. NPDC059237]|uniref:hypothetical protein n=1 Tax=Embleya sp. NPDC059237 TaxID=3346784 RepID=UPI003694B8A3